MAENAKKYIRPKAAAERVSLSVATINRALAKGDLARIKRGAATLIDVAELDAWARGDTPAGAESRTA